MKPSDNTTTRSVLSDVATMLLLVTVPVSWSGSSTRCSPRLSLSTLPGSERSYPFRSPSWPLRILTEQPAKRTLGKPKHSDATLFVRGLVLLGLLSPPLPSPVPFQHLNAVCQGRRGRTANFDICQIRPFAWVCSRHPFPLGYDKRNFYPLPTWLFIAGLLYINLIHVLYIKLIHWVNIMIAIKKDRNQLVSAFNNTFI